MRKCTNLSKIQSIHPFKNKKNNDYLLIIGITEKQKCIAALLGARFRSTESSLLGLGGGGLGGGIGGGGFGGGGGLGGDDGDTHGDFDVPAGVNMGRRRSRAVLYQLSGHYKPEKVKTKLKLNNVSALASEY